MKPLDVISDSYAKYNVDSNGKDRKFKVGDHVRISKLKNIFAKGYTPNWSEEIFFIIFFLYLRNFILLSCKNKNTVPWTYVINDLNGDKIVGTFYEKELPKTNQK